MTAAPALARLEALPDAKLRAGWSKALCPAHEDVVPSFGWKLGTEGALVLKCLAGCTFEAIVAALGLEMRDLFPPKSEGTAAAARPHVVKRTEYEVRDAAGQLVAIHVRRDMSDGSKRIAWRLADSAADDYGLKGRAVASLPLYGSERIVSWPPQAGVVITEGEKAADALLGAGKRALATFGADHKPEPDVLEVLRGRVVTLWPDADEPGRRHMLALARSLAGIVAGVTWLEPPEGSPKGWDAADLLGLTDDPATAFQDVAGRIGPVPTGPRPSSPSLAAALDGAHDYITRYVVHPSPHEPVAVALWISHAWPIDAAETSPYLAITSAEKRSGKSRLLDAIEQIAPRPWRAIVPSEAVVFRKLAQDRPTLLLDEVDAIFGTKRQAESNEGLRAILNAGNRRGTKVPRVVGEGKRMRVEDFDVFGAKALAGIGKLPDTIADRSVPVRLERRARSEPVERFRMREAEPAAIPIREGLQAALAPLLDRLAHARPDIPPSLGDRAADGWEPLLAIADAAGGDWPANARAAAIALSGERADDLDDVPASILLLADIRDAFDRRAADRLTTAQLVEELVADEERPWREWRDGKPITAHKLGRMLAVYKIKPDQMKLAGAKVRGYRRVDFQAAWERYLPPAATDASKRYSGTDEPSHARSDEAESTEVPLRSRVPDGSTEPVPDVQPDMRGAAESVFAPLGATWTNGHARPPGVPFGDPDGIDDGLLAMA